MKICVCAKQVPDTNEVRIDPVKGTLIREGVPSILNPDDANALEAALQLKDEYKDTTISVISMGPPQATYMLRECLAMGADEAVLLSDRAFGGADTCATSTTIAAGIKISDQGNILFTISDDDKQEALNIAKRFSDIGYNLLATEGTAKFLEENDLRVTAVGKINQSKYSVLDAIYNGDVDVVVNTTSKDKDVTKDGFKIRRVASEQEIVCLTSLDTADALLKVLESISFSILPL